MRASVLVALLATSACTPPGVLVARDGSHRLTARDQATGLVVVLTTGVWEGQPEDLPTHATVLHALVANLGDQAIRILPADFELRDRRGFRYASLDPGTTFRRPGEPAPEVEPSEDAMNIIGDGDIARLALPWGTLAPDSQMRGYLYFESVARTANDAALVWHVRGPDGRPVVDLRFDLYVARAR